MFELSSSDTEALASLAQSLVRTPSPSGGEGAVARILAEAMHSSGFNHVRVDRLGSVIGRVGTGRGGPVLLLDGHMDTVDPGDRQAWRHDPFGGDIDDGLLYGIGAADMKASLAAMVMAGKLLQEAGSSLRGDLIVAFVVQEEPLEGIAAGWLIEHEGIRPDFVVLGEPTNLGVALGQRGRVELQVNVHGRSHHASTPSGGINAIASAARLIFGLELLAPQLLTDPALGQGTLAVTQICSEAGSLNCIPDRCSMVIDRRLTLGETEARAISEIQQAIRREGVSAEVSTLGYEMTTYTGETVRGRKYFPPWLIPENHALVKRAVRCIERTLGAHPRVGTWAFSTDGTYTMGAAGIPTIGFGPGEERVAHTPDEHVRLSNVALSAQVYAQLAADLLR